MPQVRHVCVAQVPQRPAPCNGLLSKEGGKEVAMPGVRVLAGSYREVNHIIWDPPRPGNILQVPWEIPLGIFLMINQKMLGIDPMGFSEPWSVSYSNNFFGPLSFHY